MFAVETGGASPLRRIWSNSVAGDVFVFGPETRGLPQAVCERIGRDNSVYIPMQAPSRSLNLSNAVALVTYEAWRQLGFGA